jgi:hypothetical protein
MIQQTNTGYIQIFLQNKNDCIAMFAVQKGKNDVYLSANIQANKLENNIGNVSKFLMFPMEFHMLESSYMIQNIVQRQESENYKIFLDNEYGQMICLTVNRPGSNTLSIMLSESSKAEMENVNDWLRHTSIDKPFLDDALHFFSIYRKWVVKNQYTLVQLETLNKPMEIQPRAIKDTQFLSDIGPQFTSKFQNDKYVIYAFYHLQEYAAQYTRNTPNIKQINSEENTPLTYAGKGKNKTVECKKQPDGFRFNVYIDKVHVYKLLDGEYQLGSTAKKDEYTCEVLLLNKGYPRLYATIIMEPYDVVNVYIRDYTRNAVAAAGSVHIKFKKYIDATLQVVNALCKEVVATLTEEEMQEMRINNKQSVNLAAGNMSANDMNAGSKFATGNMAAGNNSMQNKNTANVSITPEKSVQANSSASPVQMDTPTLILGYPDEEEEDEKDLVEDMPLVFEALDISVNDLQKLEKTCIQAVEIISNHSLGKRDYEKVLKDIAMRNKTNGRTIYYAMIDIYNDAILQVLGLDAREMELYKQDGHWHVEFHGEKVV